MEDRPARVDDPPAPPMPWTHRFKPTDQPAQYEMFDHLALAPLPPTVAAGIGRRTRRTGNGSDHNPARVDLNL